MRPGCPNDELHSSFQRIPGREAQLTGRIAELCRADAVLTHGFVRALLSAADTATGGEMAAQIPARVTLTNEVKLGPKKDARWRPSGGRVDWVISGDRFRVLVEVKIGAGVAPGQLERYLNDDGFDRSTTGGLILLTRDRVVPPPKVWRHERWWGQLSWDELVPQLQQVTASDPAVQRRWSALLTELGRPGDVAEHSVGWALNGLSAGQRNARVLRAVRDFACQTVERELATRKGWTKADGLCGHRPGGGGRGVVVNGKLAGIALYVPAAGRDPVMAIDLVGIRRPLRLTTAVTITHRLLARPKARRELLARVEAAGFTVEGDACSVTDRIYPPPGVVPPDAPAAVVRAVLRERLSAIVATGVLDVHAH